MKNKKIWTFLLRFFGTYFFLFLIYFFFLKATQKKTPVFVCDPITVHVAEQSKQLLNTFKQGVITEQNTQELSVNILLDNVCIVGVIEGCNSISVIILFVAFVIAFRGSWKKTLLFCVFGALSIYYVNILRIVLLTYGMYHYYEYVWVFHDLVFPAIIYGYVFMLWIVWVNYFSDLKRVR